MLNFDQITKTMFVGTYPQSAPDIDRLRDGPRITAVLNLQSDLDMDALRIDWKKLERHYTRREMTVRHHPIRDFDPHDLTRHLRRAVACVGDLFERGRLRCNPYIEAIQGACQ